jgi:threonine synthase
VSINDDETRRIIKSAHEQHGTILEPHGAVGWAGLQRFAEEHPDHADRLAVSVETAHPAKFPDEIRAILGIEPEPPPSLAGLESRKETYQRMPADYETFRDFLTHRHTRRD